MNFHSVNVESCFRPKWPYDKFNCLLLLNFKYIYSYIYICMFCRSFGVVLYELTTGGSVPYATFSNTEVR